MSLQFIFGGSGAGKTRYLYEHLIQMSMEEPKTDYIAIVPEQFTMQTQKEIVTLHPNHGTMNIDIVSFGRLAYRVFQELAVTVPVTLDDMGKSMVLRKVAANHKKELILFSGHLNQTGFINQVKSMLAELYQYGISGEDLEGLIPQTDSPLLKQKLEDLLVLYRGFQDYIAGKFITTEEILDILCRELPKSEKIKNSVVTLDGYTGFTPVQYRLLELLMIHAKKVMVTVTIDEHANPYKESRMQNLFHMSKHTVCKLVDLAAKNGIKKDQDVVLEKMESPYRFEQGSQLDYLEKSLFRYGAKPYQGIQTNQENAEISIYQGTNPSAEVSYIIRQIQHLVRDKGYRYRDIAVITGDLAGYSREFVHQFEEQDIPYFLDEKKSILGNPMVELIRAVLELFQKDFSYESAFRYLKTGLVTEDSSQLCRLENYVLALGIRGYKRWSSSWDYQYRGSERINLEQLNAFRTQIVSDLEPIRDVMRDRKSDVRARTTALVTFLQTIHIEEKMLLKSAELDQKGEFALAKEYTQVYGLVMELCSRIVGLLGDEVVSQHEYAQILDAGFEEIKVRLIPATVDRLVVGDITRTRLDHIRALFFAGVNDGVVPSRKDSGKLITDREREFFKEHQLELAPTLREDGFMQRFYLYLMMTKPSEKLVVTCASMTAAGKSQRPSVLIGELCSMFPGMQIVTDDQNMTDSFAADITSVQEAKKQLIQGLSRYDEVSTDEKFQELYCWFFDSDEYKDQVAKLVQAACHSYEGGSIAKAVAQALYGTVVRGSVTRLERYAACAYAHFLQYGLELEKRQEYELQAVDIGNLFHNSIDLCFQKMKDEKRSWNTLTDEDRQQLVKTCVAQVTQEYGNTILQSSARNTYLSGRVERITDRTIWALAEQMKKGDFTPVGFEVSFSAVDNLEAMRIALSEEEELHLRGRIDRLDLCEDEEHVYVKIIDYKSGGTSFDLAALYYGLQLQLVVYVDAAVEIEKRKHPDKEVLPAGIFYYNIQDPMVDKVPDMTKEEVDQQILRTLKMNGLVNSDMEVVRHLDHEIETESDVIPVVLKGESIQESKSSVASIKRFDALRTFVKQKLKTMGQDILQGDVEVNPYQQGTRTACDYCLYHSVCGFDKKTNGYEFRKFKNLKSEEIWAEIEPEQDEKEEV